MNIQLFGESYKFKTNLEMVQAEKVVNLLTKEVLSVQDQYHDAISEKNKLVVLVVAALNLAKKNIELLNLNNEFRVKIDERSKELLQILDQCLSTEKNNPQ